MLDKSSRAVSPSRLLRLSLLAPLAATTLAACAQPPRPMGPPVSIIGQPGSPRTIGADEPGAPPPSLYSLQEVGIEAERAQPSIPELRARGLREVAMAYGAQGGLAARSWEINRSLEIRGIEMDRTFNFRSITLTAPGGALVLPPVVTVASDAASVSPDGQAASVARRVYRINLPGRLALREPDWRAYLVRRWDQPSLPHASFRPRTPDEAQLWRESVALGWEEGRRQADAIYESDLSRLERDFVGMTTYHLLVKQGVISEFHLAEADRGITGGGNEMRVGDRAVRITVPARLNARPGEWRPILVTAEETTPQGNATAPLPAAPGASSRGIAPRHTQPRSSR